MEIEFEWEVNYMKILNMAKNFLHGCGGASEVCFVKISNNDVKIDIGAEC